MTYCALARRHRERVSFKERKRILVLSLLVFMSLGILLFFGIQQVSAAGFELDQSDSDEILELADSQNQILLTISNLFVSRAPKSQYEAPTLMYTLMNEGNAIGKVGQKICTAVGMILVLAYGSIQVLQLLQREDESLETLIRILMTCILGYFFVIYVNDAMNAIEELGNLIFSSISDAIEHPEASSIKEAAGAAGNAISAAGFNFEEGAYAEEAAAETIEGVSNLINGGVAGFIGAILMYFTFYAILTSVYGLLFEMVIRKIFAPVAMADFATEGVRSPGARYLKNYLGVYIRISIFCIVIFMGGIACLWAVNNKEVSSVLNGNGKLSNGIGAIGAVYCIRFAMKALMNASGQITREMLGG